MSQSGRTNVEAKSAVETKRAVGAKLATDEPQPHEVGVDDPSFDVFYESQYAIAFRMALALTGSRQEAEDIASEVFVDAYRRWHKVSTYRHPHAWVRQAVANQASSFRRRMFNWHRLIRRLPTASAHDEPLLRNEHLWREVSKLPRRQAQVIVLHYLEQLTTSEIADLLGVSQASTKTHLQRARHNLGERLQPELLDISIVDGQPAGGESSPDDSSTQRSTWGEATSLTTTTRTHP